MPDNKTAPVTYLALSIGPIYETIQNAQKTRELWAASFVLSQYMKSILLALEAGGYGECLSPDVTDLHKNEKYRGAGVWNDNCFYRLHDDKVEALKSELPALLRRAKTSLLGRIETDDGAHNRSPEQLRGLLDRHFCCTAVLHTRTPGKTYEKKVLIELGDLIHSAERMDAAPSRFDDYVGKMLFRYKTVKTLYGEGFDFDDPVFTRFQKNGHTIRRMPSLLEIATREFKKHPDAYHKVVAAISEETGKAVKNRPDNRDDLEIELGEAGETAAEEIAVLDLLKAVKDGKGDSVFKKYHKYVAIVQSDGDGIGKIVKGFDDGDADGMKMFSKQLMAFSKDAVQIVADYDGLPVYAGGDDLLFIAPLQNRHGHTLFDLLETINGAFDRQEMLKTGGSSLSFGISIFYYKYPLGEALEEGRKQLFRIAKKLKYSHEAHRILRLVEKPGGTKEKEKPDAEKNACAFRVMLHGGQAFGAVLRQAGDVWNQWKTLLRERNKTDAAFLSGLIHRLERLEYLLEAACRDGTAGAFFDQHFNEATGPQKDFILQVRKLAEMIYRDYGTLHTEPGEHLEFYESQAPLSREERRLLSSAEPGEALRAIMRRRYCNNLLYSALRMIQFLKSEDHE